MIDQDKRNAIFQLHQAGVSQREIAKKLTVSRNTVKEIVKNRGLAPQYERKDRIQLDEELIARVYNDCKGWVQRTHEILTEEKNLEIGYSTLTRKLREMGLRQPHKARCESVPDCPGAEMQHDTTIYQIPINGTRTKVVASLIYFRYSKVRYLKLYRRFNRFKMKCFLHEALTHIGYTAATCIIDNTNLARLRGSGKNAVMIAEMEHFASTYGFRFQCHALNHPNRKAGNERGFYTVESNFIPGRCFKSMEDLNHQAFEWATKRCFNRGVGKSDLIPAKAFEHERSFLIPLPPYIKAPYVEHPRVTDQYGHVAFAANYYWVPGTKRDEVIILEFDQHIEIYLKRNLLIKYKLPPEGTKNQTFAPKDRPKPSRQPNNWKKPSTVEEKKIRALSDTVDSWLTVALKDKGSQKHRFIRSLYLLLLKLSSSLFIQTIERAFEYRVTGLKQLEGIAAHILKNEAYIMPDVVLNEEFQNRKNYLAGFTCDDADLSRYDKLLSQEKNG